MVDRKVQHRRDFKRLFVTSRPPRRPRAAVRPERLGGQAKKLRPEDIDRITHYIEVNSYSPEADLMKLHLTLHAGLRAKEVALLHLSDVTNPDGTTADYIRVRRTATKGKKRDDRYIPVSPQLKETINAFRAKYPDSKWLAVSHRWNTVRHQTIGATTRWINKLYQRCGLEGCSSHSGRRSFLTNLTRHIPHGHSLVDVKEIAGHVSLETTQIYMEPAEDNRAFVASASERLMSKSGRG